MEREDTAVLRRETSKGGAALRRKLPQGPGRAGSRHRLQGEGGDRGKSWQVLILGQWLGRWAAPPCPPHLVTEKRHPRIRPLLQELWTGSCVVWWQRPRLRVQPPRPGHSYLCDLGEAGSSQSQGRRSGPWVPIPEGSVLISELSNP